MAAKEWQTAMGADDKERAGEVHEARIVFVDHGSKSVRLSMRPHVLDFRGASSLPALGSVLEGLTVKSASKKQGVLLSIGHEEAESAIAVMSVVSRVGKKDDDDEEEGGKVKGAARLNKKMQAADTKRRREIDESVVGVFIHKSALADLTIDAEEVPVKGKKGKKQSLAVSEDDLEKQYRVGEDVNTVKIVGYHLVEGFAVATNMDAVIKSEVLHWSKVKVGSILSVIVSAVKDFGLLVKISPKVQAVCPLMHLSDTGLALTAVQIGKKYRVGQTLKVRVWEVEEAAIIVTLKKSIVDEKGTENSVLNYDDLIEGKKALGIVSRTGEDGIKINFFNSVKGSIPMSVLARQGVTDASDSYRIGQVVKCLVLRKTLPKEQKSKATKAKPKVN
jgi:polyribonucleotide nucleotidyltransferase